MVILQKLELLIPPPLVAIVCLFFSWWLGQVHGLWLFDNLMAGFIFNYPAIFQWLALVCMFMGAVCLITANGAFRRANTTLSPRQPQQATQLVTHGVFAISRNPMYLGIFLILLGAGLRFNSLASLVWAFVFFSYIQSFQIIPEEKILQKKFGKKYNDYCQRVRRWL